jgi:hypothetical protein
MTVILIIMTFNGYIHELTMPSMEDCQREAARRAALYQTLRWAEARAFSQGPKIAYCVERPKLNYFEINPL